LLGGIGDMKCMGEGLLVVEGGKEGNGIGEGGKLNMGMVGMVDSKCDGDEMEYVMGGNDDGIGGVKLLSGKMGEGVLEGEEGI
ncbi:30S ribosomal protein S2, partial [Staphylococcus hominis]|uniref:30S ribosomal protein S2 n=1 Tax=Staphylococcus hominis TaxID=1290 RepID=UPI001C92F7A6